MSNNAYLDRAIKRFEALNAGIEAMQTRAASEDRDMSADELRTANGQLDEAKKLKAEIDLMTEHAKANAAVRGVGAEIRGAAQAAQIDGGNGQFRTSPRDPGHYRAEKINGRLVPVGRSWLADMYAAKAEGDVAAQTRMAENSAHVHSLRTGDTTATVPGVIQPVYFTDLFTQMMQQQAVLSALAPAYPLNSANPFYLPGQTATTTEVNGGAENAAVTSSDSYAATYASGSPVTPTVLTAKETLSRQLLDGANPAVDALILSDFARTMVTKKENLVGAAILGVGSALTSTQALFLTMTTASTNGWDEIVTATNAVRSALFERPDALVCDYDFFGALLKLKDSAGRPLLVSPSNGPTNALGQADLQNDGWIGQVPLYVSGGMKGGTPATWYGAVIKSSYIQQFQSAMLNFRYEEQAGPQSIILGCWQYYAVAVRQGTRAAKNITAT